MISVSFSAVNKSSDRAEIWRTVGGVASPPPPASWGKGEPGDGQEHEHREQRTDERLHCLRDGWKGETEQDQADHGARQPRKH